MKRLFGTAGIRGVTNVDITPRLALDIALAYGDLLAEGGKPRPTVAVGHDTRYGSEMLARAATAGFLSAGCDVRFLACVPTGVFCLNLREEGLDGGLLVTGSHMPPDRNGLLAVLPDGACAPPSVTDRIEERYHALPSRSREVPADRIGRLQEEFHSYEKYVSHLVREIPPHLIQKRKFHVLIDPANGTASYVAKELFEWYGCTVEMIHYDPAPVPARPSEPRAATVGEASRKVRELGCDLGVCFDVDADRALFLTSSGEAVSEDTIGALFARDELRPGETCVVPINSSGLIEQVCRAAQARLEFCAVGQPRISEAIRTLGAVTSYEESGKYFFPRKQMWVDGLYSTLRLLDLLTRRNETLEEAVAPFPRFYQSKQSIHVEEGRSDAIFRAATKLLESRLREGTIRDVTVDGFKRCYGDDSWLLIRASGTEPLIRVYSDAPTRERADELVRKGVDVVQEALTKS